MNKKLNILIVDDVPANIHTLMSILKDDYTITAATSGEKTLQLLQTSTPDLILLDILMPNMNGYEVCRKIKENANTSNIPIIFVTSLNSIEEQEKGRKAGGIDFITKPFSKELVLNKVNTYLKINTLEKGRIMNNSKQSILIVDDSPENIHVIIEVLKKDYIVSVAISGKKALNMLNDGLRPDLILLDVIMPEMDGYTLCEKIKEIKEYMHIPIIFVTVLEKEKDIVKGLELGAVDYVVKPIEPIVLKARVQTHLKLKTYQDQLIHDLQIKDELILNQSKLAIIGEMFETITDQWKQPLTTISVATSGIKLQKEHKQLTDEILISTLDNITKSVEYLSESVNDFKSFLVMDSKKYRFDIKDIIDKTLLLLKSKFKNSSINIINKVENIEITNFQNDLIQILMNILINAKEAFKDTNKNKEITIESSINKENIILSITDNAGGIEENIFDKIFDKHFTSKSYNEGSGLGLYMSKKIIKEHLNGEIKVSNVKDGASFKIILPKE
ncbi:response regulator [Poseidonibacter lekithochrous]|uniref:ATP-binding response regulator n=1 Tax=Poseidonibacter TaxID=2321187 RepID=UPI001C094DD3|nr:MULTISPECIES: hybrid sensor histidine kinase/response regulator [Poseidonibacter]MBU3013155.1 response regulator [Poseidonibacter lekithochrous]MDO6826451.1 response regulator [Poseidonibacter sp. 1_MG-2023]